MKLREARRPSVTLLLLLSFAPLAGACTKRRSTATAPDSAPAARGARLEASAHIVAPRPDCGDNGCLREVTRVGDFSKATLEPLLARGATVDNGYTVFTVTFATSGRSARATVTVPFDVAAPPAGWHTVANAHGTTGIASPCAVAGTVLGAGLSGTFGARGFVGVAVDYPGLGTPGLHPYLVADSEGHAVLDALRATAQLAGIEHIALSGRSAVVGLSQGGHAALSAAMRHKAYAPELDIRAFAAAGPASGFEEHWRAGARIDGWHLPVHALLVYAWAAEYGYHGPELWAPAVAPAIDRIMHERCMYSALGAPALRDALGTERAKVFSPAFLAAYQSGRWGEFALFAEAFRKNRIAPYPQTAPLKIYQGDADDIVPEWSTRQLVDALRAGGVTVDYELVPGGSHVDVAFGAVIYRERRTDDSLAWLRARLGG